MASKKTTAPAKTLTLRVEGTNLQVETRLPKGLAQSKAGSKGFSFSTCCNAPVEHTLPDGTKKVDICGKKTTAPYLCPDEAHKDRNLRAKDQSVKGYELGDEMVYLTHEQVDALNPQGDNTIRILHMLDPREAGAPPCDGLVPHFPKMRAITPAKGDDGTLKTWAALHALIGRNRVAFAEVVEGGDFYHAFIYAAESGALLVLECYLRRDVYETPGVTLPTLTPEEMKAINAKGASLVRPVDVAELDRDPYRDAREQAILAAIGRGAKMVEVTAPAPAIPKKEVDVLALLG